DRTPFRFLFVETSLPQHSVLTRPGETRIVDEVRLDREVRIPRRETIQLVIASAAADSPAGCCTRDFVAERVSLLIHAPGAEVEVHVHLRQELGQRRFLRFAASNGRANAPCDRPRSGPGSPFAE